MVFEFIFIIFFWFLFLLFTMFNNLSLWVNILHNPQYNYLTNSWYVRLERISQYQALDYLSDALKIWWEENSNIEVVKDFYYLQSDNKTNVITL